MQAPPPAGSAPSNYPRQNSSDDRQVLRNIAAAQKQVVYCVLGQIGIVILNALGAAGHIVAVSYLVFVLALALLVLMIISIIKLANALGLSPILYAILMIVPCVSLIVLLVLSQKATTRLQQAGIKVGLLGADASSI